MRLSLASLGRFALFAVAAGCLFWLWARGGAGDVYGRAVVWTASPVVRVTSGFRVVEIRNKPDRSGIDVVVQRGAGQPLILPVQPREQFSGLIPFLALMLVTPGLALAARLKAMAAGVGLQFAFHLGLTLFGPFLATAHVAWVNKIIDVAYGFVGLVGYVALPFVLWLWLSGAGEKLLQRPLLESEA